MRPDMARMLERGREKAETPLGRGLVRLVDELVALAELASEMQEAQDAYWALARKSQRNQAQMERALAKARHLEDLVRRERARLGFTGQGALPGLEE